MKALYSLDFSFVQLPQIQAALHELDRKNVAKELIAVLGNQKARAEYRVRQLIEEAISSSVLEGAKPTTRELARRLVLELHRILGEDALEVPDAAGQLRGPEHPVVVEDLKGTVWHVPPAASGLRDRLELLLPFDLWAERSKPEGLLHSFRSYGN